jgi:cyclic pyranopterin phosphate synthase
MIHDSFEQGLTHLTASGQPQMVDVTAKPVTERIARARAVVVLGGEVLRALEAGVGDDAVASSEEITTKKGAVFHTAIIAGIMAAKKTGELIPLCHPLGMSKCAIDIRFNAAREVVIDCTASVSAQTGVEMEALTGATVAALTVYDMCKALSHDIHIKDVRLMEKRGGKRDFRRKDAGNGG